MSGLARAESGGQVATVVLDRPERHNALVPELLEDLRVALADAAGSGARAVVLRAAGRSFSTGGDLAGFAAHADDLAGYADRLVGLLGECVLGLLDLPVPVVARVQGPVTGGALGLVLASDVVVASEDAWFAPYYGEVGLSPDGGWTALLPAMVGRLRAAEVQVRNRRVGAAEARDWGLVSDVVAAEALDAAVDSAAAAVTRLRPGSLRRTRELLRPDRQALESALARERRHFVEQIDTEEARRGLEGFSPRASRGGA